jgi:hypothetical protein
MVHCSDGWDRTSQLVSLSLLLLDPFYRTLSGFQVLIEKEWCSVGHKFADRCGHMKKEVPENEFSPVFLQFIECVWHITQQFPYAFEFNETLLIFLLEHLYSCQFGTFLFNSQKDREAVNIAATTPSIWTAVNQNYQRFLNVFYNKSAFPALIMISTESKHIQFWQSYYMAHAFPAPVPLTSNLSALVSDLVHYQMALVAEYKRIERTLNQFRQRSGDLTAEQRAPKQLAPEISVSASTEPLAAHRASFSEDPISLLLLAAQSSQTDAVPEAPEAPEAPRPRKMSKTTEDLPLPRKGFHRSFSQAGLLDLDTPLPRGIPVVPPHMMTSQPNLLAVAWDSQLAHLPPPVRKAMPSSGKIIYSGFVHKRGAKRKNWCRRLFVLHQHALFYFKSISDLQPKGTLSLTAEATVSIVDTEGKTPPVYGFVVVSPARTLYCRVPHQDSRARWMEVIQQCIDGGAAATSEKPAVVGV